ncbi:glycosyltransferase [Streptomyces sp. VRA16 Mangrove soil]|uniref:glycosyltransferase n=1 Tax=Streptomyces sp. VRA16 Mangrove soil TaxID=2817434 RepID=UPI001AA0065A|nr:glycosyltransferase [Streptomyces sp. VRA16 Mangrove soil]MBO1330982.1 glycosyltransferase [Streptomyces sp. VRA16 Mangrove soil]
MTHVIDTGVSAAGEPQHAPPRLTVVVPTRNEQESVPLLLAQLGPAVGPLNAEILFVDDSDDATVDEITAAAVDSPVPVRVLHREQRARGGGLSGAVVAGVRAARGAWVLVMDADLQHPPQAAALLARTAMREGIDIAVGTRYAGGGASAGLAGAGRQATSSGATRLVKASFPRRLATVSDPLSGLFAFRRDAVDVERLRPVGFKILLEILVRHPAARVAEVAYTFEPRQAGRSKASVREGFAFVRHVGRLRRSVAGGQRRLMRMAAFGAVGASGILVNTAALYLFFDVLGVHHLVGAALATQFSTAWNFVLTDAAVYRKRERIGSWSGRAGRFFAMNNLLLLARLPLLQWLVLAGVGVLTANALTLVLLFLLRFLVSDRMIYRGGEAKVQRRDPVRVLVDTGSTTAASPAPAAAKKRSVYLPYRYDVAGTVTIGSQIRLPELEFFRAQWVPDADVDIAVRVGDVGRRRPRRRAALTEDPGERGTALRYEEHLGRLGANFRVTLGPPITVEVGPLLARSPHVVYTNVVEALLRFVLISRGRMLLHSACLELGGHGVMLSALTDTGKTATILRLLREQGGRFLSDDMTVVDASGLAVCFPKPLTISSHTLRAVQAEDLTRKEWRRLNFQSRLHSKGGRSIALMLSRFNLPIMGINAITQILVPPPKYSVDRLVPCRLGSRTRVEELFIIERGAPRLSGLDRAAALERMLVNTEDAYGFPPYRYLAPALRIDGMDYDQLRAKEREILAGFLSGVRTRVLASDCFGWADEIPRLVGDDAPSHTVSVNSLEAWPRWGLRPGTAA